MLLIWFNRLHVADMPGISFLAQTPPPPITAKPIPFQNRAIMTVYKTTCNVVASAAKAETGGLYNNAQDAIIIHIALEELGHPQPPTPIKTDNTTAHSFVHNNIKQRKPKTWDMRWNWLRNRTVLKQLRIYWEKGVLNEADYHTKHHPPVYHITWWLNSVFNAHNLKQQPDLLTKLHKVVASVCTYHDPYDVPTISVTSRSHDIVHIL